MAFQLNFYYNSLLFCPLLTSSFPRLFTSYLQELISCLYHKKTIHWFFLTLALKAPGNGMAFYVS